MSATARPRPRKIPSGAIPLQFDPPMRDCYGWVEQTPAGGLFIRVGSTRQPIDFEVEIDFGGEAVSGR